jgi:hypothetical protein
VDVVSMDLLIDVVFQELALAFVKGKIKSFWF